MTCIRLALAERLPGISVLLNACNKYEKVLQFFKCVNWHNRFWLHKFPRPKKLLNVKATLSKNVLTAETEFYKCGTPVLEILDSLRVIISIMDIITWARVGLPLERREKKQDVMPGFPICYMVQRPALLLVLIDWHHQWREKGRTRLRCSSNKSQWESWFRW